MKQPPIGKYFIATAYWYTYSTDGDAHERGPHRPVDNDAQAWRHLLSNRLLCSKTTERPTPMTSSKRRAIYLDGVPQAA